MKIGDTVFGHTDIGVSIVGEITKLTDRELVIEVENGGYNLHFTVRNDAPAGNYNDKVNWFSEQEKS